MVLWDFGVHTDKKIDSNRPDIIIQDFKERACTMLHVMPEFSGKETWQMIVSKQHLKGLLIILIIIKQQH